VVNLPSFDKVSLEAVRVVGLPFAPGVSELEKAGLSALPSNVVQPPRIAQCPRHFECKLDWSKEWAGRLMVVGEVMAASANADCVDEQGYVRWDRARPAHYCGAPYGGTFVAAHQTMAVGLPYDGPEVAEFHAREQAMFKER
jgi:flavin reductase (DIM6/NTAB) family NADH-FMN oxidoreductase RutF